MNVQSGAGVASTTMVGPISNWLTSGGRRANCSSNSNSRFVVDSQTLEVFVSAKRLPKS